MSSSEPPRRRPDAASDRQAGARPADDLHAPPVRDIDSPANAPDASPPRDRGALPPDDRSSAAGARRGTGRRTIARYDEYPSAQRAVDYLADERFPVEHVTIVGAGLRYVEQVTGRRNYGRAMLEGAASGLVLGALLGWFFGLFSLVDPLVSGLVLALWGAVIGAIIGALIGGLAHAATGGRRDFSSVSGYHAEAYELQVDEARADEAERLLSRMPTRI